MSIETPKIVIVGQVTGHSILSYFNKKCNRMWFLHQITNVRSNRKKARDDSSGKNILFKIERFWVQALTLPTADVSMGS